MPHTTDVAIIGAGPAGLFTVFEMGMQGYSCVVCDALPHIGGQLTELYPEKPIYDIPGHGGILARDLIKNLEAQAAPFNPLYLLGNPVNTLTENEDGTFTLHTAEETVHAKVVVVAAGGGMFAPRKPPLENLHAYEEKSVFYAVRQKASFAEQSIVIAGGGDSAVDWAVELAETATHIHLIHRRNDFRAAPDMVEKMRELEQAGKITLHVPYQLSALEGDTRTGILTGVTVADLDGATKTIPADKLLCFFGLAPSVGFLTDWHLTEGGKTITVNPKDMTTSRKGILAVGDIADYEGKLSLILTGFAEAAVAARTAQGLINPEKKFRAVYSTSVGVPGQK